MRERFPARIAGLLCWLMGVSPSLAASLDRAAVHDLFSQAKDLFRRANDQAAKDPAAARDLYQQAALRFECIATQGGVRNGRLFYNIGNAWFRMGDVGRAILYYRRAEQLIPNDPNLRQNLDYARARRTDRIEPRQRTRVLRTLFFWHYDLAPRTRLVLFAVCSAALWALAAVRLFRPATAPRWAIALVAVLALAVLASLGAEAISEARHREGVVLAPEVVARKGDAETYQPSFTEPLHAGTEFQFLEDRGEWLHIELADGRRCWVPAKTVGVIGQEG